MPSTNTLDRFSGWSVEDIKDYAMQLQLRLESIRHFADEMAHAWSAPVPKDDNGEWEDRMNRAVALYRQAAGPHTQAATLNFAVTSRIR